MGENTMHQPDHTANAPRSGHVRAIVRHAEEMIASGDYTAAQRQLAEAWTLDPGNPYIPAIAERIALLQKLSRHESSKIAPRNLTSAADQALQNRIRRLTTVATSLFERGSDRPALEALMKAYLLDPMHPDVVACEKKLLPAWDALRKQGAVPGLPDLSSPAGMSGAAAAVALRLMGKTHPAGETGRGSALQSTQPSALAGKLDALKRQREAQRADHEQALWRNASGTPKVPKERRTPD
jgi:hypothetical protein